MSDKFYGSMKQIMRNLKRAVLVSGLSALLLVGCDSGKSEAKKSIASAEIDVRCDGFRQNVLFIVHIMVATEKDDPSRLEAIVKRIENGTFDKKNEIFPTPPTGAEMSIARELYKHRSAWEKIPVGTYVTGSGKAIDDQREKEGQIWKIGREICRSQLSA